MDLFSAVYVVAALALYRLGSGDAALVYANIGNLAMRIAHRALFAARFFRSTPRSRRSCAHVLYSPLYRMCWRSPEPVC